MLIGSHRAVFRPRRARPSKIALGGPAGRLPGEQTEKQNQCARSTYSGGLLFGQRVLEGLLSVSDEILIACRVNEDARAILWIALQFREYIEIPTVRSKKYVAG